MEQQKNQELEVPESEEQPLDLRQSPARESIGFLLAVSAYRMRSRFEQALEPMGLQARHFGILATLTHFGPTSQQRLSSSCCIDRSTMVSLIDDLERAGYVRRQPDAEDRRVHQIHLTDAGTGAFQRASELARMAEDDCLDMLSDRERAELKRMLQQVANIDGSSGFEHINIRGPR